MLSKNVNSSQVEIQTLCFTLKSRDVIACLPSRKAVDATIVYSNAKLHCTLRTGCGPCTLGITPLYWNSPIPYNIILPCVNHVLFLYCRIAGHPLAQNERCLHMFLQESVIDRNYVPGKVCSNH